MRWGLAGHDAAIERLERAHAAGTLAHAYLISGPEGVGKTALALRLAQMVNCDAEDAPCGECRSCVRIQTGKHPDVMTMTLGKPDLGYNPERPNERYLGIERVKALEHAAALQAFEGRCRVFIIDGAESLSREAENALLKTLEEPPAAVLLLLVTAEEDALLPTIRSRVQRVALGTTSHAEIAALLTALHHIEPLSAERIARLAQGRAAWAVAAATQPELLERREASQAELLGLVSASTDRRFAWAGARATEFGKNRSSVLAELNLALDIWHNILLLKAVGADSVTDDRLLPSLRTVVQPLDVGTIVRVMEAVRSAITALERNANPRLALEVLMLELPDLPRTANVT